MNHQPLVSIYILSHDRPVYAANALLSAMSQTYKNIKVIFSDNSSNYNTKNYLDSLEHLEPGSYEYRYRNNIHPLAHFNNILDEVDTDYVLLFHDDDVLKNDYIEHAINIFLRDKSLVCVACNADTIDENNNFTGKYNPSFISRDKLISSKEDFYDHYFSYKLFRAPPYPSYLYKTQYLNKATKSYKYFDVEFVASMLEFGDIFWSKEAKIKYRFHKNNDSNKDSIIHRKALIGNIVGLKNISKKKKDIYSKNIRFFFWMGFFLKSEKDILNKRFAPALKFILSQFFLNTYKISLYLSFKLCIKILKIIILKTPNSFQK